MHLSFLSWHCPRIPYSIAEIHILQQHCSRTKALLKDTSEEQKFRELIFNISKIQISLCAIGGVCVEMLEEAAGADFTGMVAIHHYPKMVKYANVCLRAINTWS